MLSLKSSSFAFTQKKARILDQLSVPSTEYSDASPKGSVDERIRQLIDKINQIDGIVTTSSCAGRVSVYLEGVKSPARDETGRPDEGSAAPPLEDVTGPNLQESARASPGGKGGGKWLYVSHNPLPVRDHGEWAAFLGLEGREDGTPEQSSRDRRLIRFKFEPMILHVLAASQNHARLVLQAGMEAGFRETGALLGGKDDTVMVCVRSMGMSFESLVGFECGGMKKCMVSNEYLDVIVGLANKRFVENSRRISRFEHALQRLFLDDGEWEEPEVRRARKREEGLRKKAEVEAEKKKVENMDVVDREGSLNDPIIELGLS